MNLIPTALSFSLFWFGALAASTAAQDFKPVRPVPDLAPPKIVQAPVLQQNPNPSAPLAAVLTLATNEPTNVELRWRDGQRSWTAMAEPKFKTNHEVAVLGMRPGRTHEITVTVRDANGNYATWPNLLVYTTPGLPAFFPPLETTVSEPSLMEPGVTMFNAGSAGNPTGFLVMVDAQGEVVWYYTRQGGIGDARRLRNGNLLFQGSGAIEIDMLGNTLNHWYPSRLNPGGAPPGAILVDTDTFHHEISEMPAWTGADFVVLSTELREYPNYPASETDPSQTTPIGRVVGDVIVEFKRSGEIVRETKLLDILDPYRISYNSLSGFWDNTYPPGNTKDWSHGNAVVFANYDNAYIVSARSQDAIVKIGRTSGALEWILGPHERWSAPWNQYLLTPVGSPNFEWSYHQHAPQVLPGGDILMYDNGNGRAIPPVPEMPVPDRYSRAVHYRVDKVAMTTEQVWAYGPPPPAGESYYCGTRGDADIMRTTGNVLVTDADRKNFDLLQTFARIFEVTKTDPAQIVFEMYIRDNTVPNPQVWNSYRAERLRNIYPHL